MSLIQKFAFRCPYCEHTQNEVADFIQTICQHCGCSYTRAQSTAPRGFIEESDATTEVSAKNQRNTLLKKTRCIACVQCGHEHTVAAAARSSICPKCGASISLEDIVITHHTSKPIDTRGSLTIEKTGFLNSSSTTCRSAVIKGKISGSLFCDETLRLSCTCRIDGRLTASKILIDRRAHIVFVHPVRAKRIIVRGVVSGVLVCDGIVHLKRGGVITGAVFARSFQADTGGQFLGSITINTQAPPESLAPKRKPQAMPELKVVEPTPHRIIQTI